MKTAPIITITPCESSQVAGLAEPTRAGWAIKEAVAA